MNDTNIKKDIDSVIINIETPHDDTNTVLQELERDNWGRILNNQTFTKMKDNFRLIKKAVSNFLTEVVNDLKLISDKITKNETDIDTIGKKVKNLEDNGGKIDENTLALLADKTEENIFKENNTFEKNVNAKVYNLDGNRLAEMQSDSITIGDTGKSINIIGSSAKLLYNGQEISGSSGGSGGSSDEGYFIARYPIQDSVKVNSNEVPYLETSYKSDLSSYDYIHTVTLQINRTSNPFTSIVTNTNTMTGNIVKSRVSTDGSYVNTGSSSWVVQSNSIANLFKDVFKINNIKDKILIKRLCGISFKLTVSIEVTSASSLITNYTPSETYAIPQYSEIVEIPVKTEDESLYLYNIHRSAGSNYLYTNTNIVSPSISYINNLQIDNSQIINGATTFNIVFDSATSAKIKTIYDNADNKIILKIRISEINLLKLAKVGGGSSGLSVGAVDISSAYGVPVLTYTPTFTSLGNFTLTKINVDNILNLDETQYSALFNGDIPIVSDGVNQYTSNRGVPVVFKMYSGETIKNLIIPCNRNNVTIGLLDRLFNDNLSLLPLNKIYGFTFEMELIISRISTTNEVTKMFSATKSLEFRVYRDNMTTLSEIFSTKGAIKLISSTSNDFNGSGDWWLFNTFNLEGNENSSVDDMSVYFKFMKRGLYNNCYIKNYITNTETQEKIWESMYITNASPFFENLDTLLRYNISIETRNSKILLKI